MKYMDLNEFVSSGLLQEVNRQFFHPLGLALEVMCEEDGTVTAITGIQDNRCYAEGMYFGEFTEDSVRKMKEVEDLMKFTKECREEMLGYFIQPVEIGEQK